MALLCVETDHFTVGPDKTLPRETVSALCVFCTAGFKLFTRDTAALVFSSLHLQRWAFDIELIYICQLMGVPMAVRRRFCPYGFGVGESVHDVSYCFVQKVSTDTDTREASHRHGMLSIFHQPLLPMIITGHAFRIQREALYSAGVCPEILPGIGNMLCPPLYVPWEVVMEHSLDLSDR